jgi:SAM-dependent methyltransferase
VLVETARPLSQSAIWKLLREFYTARGIDAWGGGPVPFLVTNHPRRALGYARFVAAWIETWRQHHRLSLQQPVHVIELGAGTGQFALHFLRAWWSNSGPPTRQPMRYILTDLPPRNVEFWRKQGLLLEFARDGRLDFARFDALAPGPLRLEHAGEVLSPSMARPVVLIANYFFDSLPTDWFRSKDGQLREWYVELTAASARAGPHRVPKERYIEMPVHGTRYRDERFQQILEGMHRRNLPGFPFPLAGLQCLDWWVHQTGGRLLAIMSDKALTGEADFRRCDRPRIQRHGSQSIMVNFSAFVDLCQAQGGQALVGPTRGVPLETAVLAWGLGANGLSPIRWLFDDLADVSNPNDLNVATMPRMKDTGRAEHALCMVRASLYDPVTFLTWSEQLAKCPRRLVGELIEVIQRVVDRALPVLGPHVDLWLVCATILMQAGEPQAALPYLATSLKQGPARWVTLWVLATCYLRLDRHDEMWTAWRQAVAAVPPQGSRRRFRELRRMFEGLCRVQGVRLAKR